MESRVIAALFLCPEGGEAVVSCERCIPAGGAGSDADVCGGIQGKVGKGYEL